MKTRNLSVKKCYRVCCMLFVVQFVIRKLYLNDHQTFKKKSNIYLDILSLSVLHTCSHFFIVYLTYMLYLVTVVPIYKNDFQIKKKSLLNKW